MFLRILSFLGFEHLKLIWFCLCHPLYSWVDFVLIMIMIPLLLIFLLLLLKKMLHNYIQIFGYVWGLLKIERFDGIQDAVFVRQYFL